MTAYKLTHKASEDIFAIFEYGIETYGPEQALNYRDELIAKIKEIAARSKLYRLRTEMAYPARVAIYHNIQYHRR